MNCESVRRTVLPDRRSRIRWPQRARFYPDLTPAILILPHYRCGMAWQNFENKIFCIVATDATDVAIREGRLRYAP